MISNRRKIIIILSIMTSAICIVAVLAIVAMKPINNKNGFIRYFKDDELKLLKAIEKPKDVVDFAGNTPYNLFFKTTDPGKLFVLDSNGQNKHYITYPIPQSKKILSGFKVIVDSPYVNIIAGNVPGIVKIEMHTKKEPEFYKLPSLFTRSAPIGSFSYALRMFDGLDQILVKVNCKDGDIKKAPDSTSKRRDAGIPTDGILEFDKINNQLVYVHFYDNTILYIDTNLNQIKKFKTIDTLTQPMLRAGSTSRNTISNLTPKRLVNAISTVAEGRLYVNSRLLADNEAVEKFKANSIIDVYNTKNHHYLGSFYIPDFDGQKPQTFKVFSDKIMVMYKQVIVCYSLSKLFDHLGN